MARRKKLENTSLEEVIFGRGYNNEIIKIQYREKRR